MNICNKQTNSCKYKKLMMLDSWYAPYIEWIFLLEGLYMSCVLVR